MKKIILVSSISLGISLLQSGVMAQAVAPPAKNASPKTFYAPPSEGEIAMAKAKGLVWTNPTTKVYHKGGEFYGKTTSGKFMTEADAIKQYYRPSPDVMKKNGSPAKAAPSYKKK